MISIYKHFELVVYPESQRSFLSSPSALMDVVSCHVSYDVNDHEYNQSCYNLQYYSSGADTKSVVDPVNVTKRGTANFGLLHVLLSCCNFNGFKMLKTTDSCIQLCFLCDQTAKKELEEVKIGWMTEVTS